MRTENAHFNSLDFWLNNKCKSLPDVLDFARCLEDLAYPVIRNWYSLDGSENRPQPSISEMLN